MRRELLLLHSWRKQQYCLKRCHSINTQHLGPTRCEQLASLFVHACVLQPCRVPVWVLAKDNLLLFDDYICMDLQQHVALSKRKQQLFRSLQSTFDHGHRRCSQRQDYASFQLPYFHDERELDRHEYSGTENRRCVELSTRDSFLLCYCFLDSSLSANRETVNCGCCQPE